MFYAIQGESIDFFGYFLVEVFQHASLLLGVTFCTGPEEIDCSFDGLLLDKNQITKDKGFQPSYC